MGTTGNFIHREPWNKGKIVGTKGALQTRGHLGATRSAPNGRQGS